MKTFDSGVERSWQRFEEKLGWALDEIGESRMLLEVDDAEGDGAAPYVQFLGFGDEIMAEVSSNHYLAEPHQLDDVQMRALAAIGWQPPDDETPNWWCEAARSNQALLRSMAVATFRQVFQVVDPAFLASDGLTAAESEDPDEFVIGRPSDSAELRDMVGRALAAHWKDVEIDSDGDYPVVQESGATVWVSVVDAAPVVRIWGFSANGVERRAQALRELNVLNRRVPFVKFYLDGDSVMVETEVCGQPLVTEHLVTRVDLALMALTRESRDLAERVNAQPTVDAHR